MTLAHYSYNFVVINGEKAAVNNPLFAQKRERTLEMLIRNIHQEYSTEINKVILLDFTTKRSMSND